MTLSAENTLAQLVVDRAESRKVLLKRVIRGTSSNVEFDVLPAAVIWYHTTNFVDLNAPKASGGGSRVDSNSQCIWIEEYPLLGAVVFASDQEEALLAMEELKLSVTGYMPTLADRDVMFPLHPAHFEVPFNLSGAECVGLFFETQWQFRNDLST
jgi:hypothetical protein